MKIPTGVSNEHVQAMNVRMNESSDETQHQTIAAVFSVLRTKFEEIVGGQLTTIEAWHLRRITEECLRHLSVVNAQAETSYNRASHDLEIAYRFQSEIWGTAPGNPWLTTCWNDRRIDQINALRSLSHLI